jgi:adenylate kinase family enzyme
VTQSPTLFVLAGMPGSGKSVLASRLAAERWRRIEGRNHEPGAIPIAREQLEEFDAFWEPPGAEERSRYDVVRDW